MHHPFTLPLIYLLSATQETKPAQCRPATIQIDEMCMSSVFRRQSGINGRAPERQRAGPEEKTTETLARDSPPTR